MKTTITACLAIAAIAALASCTTVVEKPDPVLNTTTTTTERATVRHPLGGTTETKTTRTY
jgi:outer membrane protein assembly factor BamE (lipoprotein component of BamABCDE complex)